ncbi:hypothetical protein EII18_10750 [Comamonadaceae bacterium OH3737_COT-264]|nr:hypothetical protein EII18_10750 [Comamonadaceae bacterium OH3737_COT-264]
MSESNDGNDENQMIFLPFAIFDDRPDGVDLNNPLNLIIRQVKDAHAILISTNKKIANESDPFGFKKEISDVSLELMNWWASLLTAKHGEVILENEKAREREKAVIWCSFMAGLRAMRLLELTCRTGEIWKEGESALVKSIRKNNASLGASAKLANDPKQEDKKRVMECWILWNADPSRYASKAAFARDMLEKFTTLKSQHVIERWCREWEKSLKN